ncbi:unnamed protein product [Sphagnum jensenii]|uniref:AAA+ ATPase domain-containing protein n=1 Tax=Sphagnum jensenii TaxID=128206 RepID=A0ABP0XDZ6_9BRYO
MRRNSSRKGVGVGQLQASKQSRSNPHLVNRLQEYAQTHNLEDLDGALEFLRRHYPEYKRKQTGPLRKYIATLVPLVQRRLWAPANLDDVPLGNNSRASPNSVKDQRLLEQEQEHVSRRRDDVAGDMNEDLTFEGFENSSDNSEGIDSDDTCKSDALEDDGGATNAEESKLSQKHKREVDRARATNKRGKYVAEKNERRGVEIDIGVTKATSLAVVPQKVSFKNFGGIEATLGLIRELIEYPLMHSELYGFLGAQLPGGVLLHGPPGCGKTMLAHAIAVETGVPLLKMSAPEVVSGMSGESEAKVRSLFAEAVKVAPCIIFIDEIDAITPKRETAQREMERRIVAQLLICMDDLRQASGDFSNRESSEVYNRVKHRGHVVVIGATNRPDSLDPALRRPGRFDREIALGIPDEDARERILVVLASNMRLEGTVDFKAIARRTPGFVGADLAAVTTEAATIAVKRILSTKETSDTGLDQDLWKRPWTLEEMEPLAITMGDFEEAVGKVQPSAKREGFATIPDVTWNDVGSLGSVRKELEFSISRPIKYPEVYQGMGLDLATGVLLYGPPGCGKTLVAKAIANDAGANFMCVKGPELLNKFVGESERAVRQLFARARNSSPCIIFFDEIDALAPSRGNDGNGAADRVVNQLLTEMDGLEKRKNIYLIAATNRPDMVDSALLRPGRLDKLLYVPLPDPAGRASILNTLVRRVPLAGDVDVPSIGMSQHCEGFSGADLGALVREACIAALQEQIDESVKMEKAPLPGGVKINHPFVRAHHFEAAFSRVAPSVSSKDQLRYKELHKKIRPDGHINKTEQM